MILYRVVHGLYSKDLSGTGARMTGGRWNPKGIPVLYTSETRSLAALEFLAHVDKSCIPSGIKILSIDFNSTCGIYDTTKISLPADWDINPYSGSLYTITDMWLKSKHSFLMKVPSSIIPDEYNYVINPMHPDIINTTIITEIDFLSISRLI